MLEEIEGHLRCRIKQTLKEGRRFVLKKKGLFWGFLLAGAYAVYGGV